MRNLETESFDFDEWASLAKVEPEEFEQRRSDSIRGLIANAGRTDQRLQGLQFRIDMERTLARTAMKSCLTTYTLMWDSFFDLNDALQKMLHKSPRNGLILMQSQHVQNAQIILFKVKNK
jgi:hypothetical protein